MLCIISTENISNSSSYSWILFFFKSYFYLFVCIHVCESQVTTCRNQFSPSTIVSPGDWIQGIKTRGNSLYPLTTSLAPNNVLLHGYITFGLSIQRQIASINNATKTSTYIFYYSTEVKLPVTLLTFRGTTHHVVFYRYWPIFVLLLATLATFPPYPWPRLTFHFLDHSNPGENKMVSHCTSQYICLVFLQMSDKNEPFPRTCLSYRNV